MKKLFLLTVLLALGLAQVSGQSYIEYVENKGQWDANIQYLGRLANGAIALENNGYRINLYNANDLDNLAQYFHSHNDNDTKLNKKGSIQLGGNGDEIPIRGHSYQVRFLNANPNPIAIPEKKLSSYNNYFYGNDPKKWGTKCGISNAVVYKDMYPNIDVKYYAQDGIPKYDIIVHPGGNPEAVALEYIGADKIVVKAGKLTVYTSVDKIVEGNPTTYHMDNGVTINVDCKYEVNNNIVRFRVDKNRDKSKVLVIDPTLVFSTFTGSRADNWGYTATYDAAGNFYGGGTVFGAGFPTSTGAYQSSFGGGSASGGETGLGFDIALIKFNPLGTQMLYGTYLGGKKGNEQPHSMIVDNAGNLIVAGRTTSSDYPVTVGKYGPAGIDDWDIMISVLSPDGTQLLASRQIGGSGSDGVNILPKYARNLTITPEPSYLTRRNYGDDARSEVILSKDGDIIIGSCTQSFDFPVTTNAPQKTIMPSTGANIVTQDGIILKISPDLSNIRFSTLYGGDGADAVFVLAEHPLNNTIYFAGGTSSTTLPGNFSQAIFSKKVGTGLTDTDGYIGTINSAGTSFLNSTYLGTTANDIIFGIQMDKKGFPYVMGTTEGSWKITNAAWNQASGKQFISKLDQNLSKWIYSTAFGPSTSTYPNISPVAFLVDRCENVYLSGWGGGVNTVQGYKNSNTNGLPITSDAYQSRTDGSDMYFMCMQRDAKSLLYGTFFGQAGGTGEHVDGGTSRFDPNGIIYQAICANCNGGNFPTTPGVWSSINGAVALKGCNLAAVKIAFNLAGVAGEIKSSIAGSTSDTAGCVPLKVGFKDVIGKAQFYLWNFGDGTPQIQTINSEVEHIFTSYGYFNVRLIAVDSNSCNISDTSYQKIKVGIKEATLDFSYLKLGDCYSKNYQFINTSTPYITQPFSDTSFLWNFGDGTTRVTGTDTIEHLFPGIGTYIITLQLKDTIFCNYLTKVTKTLTISPLVSAAFVAPSKGCVPFTPSIQNYSIAADTYLWDFGDGSPTSKDTVPKHTYSTPGTYTITLTASNSSTCNKDSTIKKKITILPKPVADFSFYPVPPEVNKPIYFANNSKNAELYKWYFGDGDSVVTAFPVPDQPHIYNKSGVYKACFVAVNELGCTDTICKFVSALIQPLVAVPNAFTPNNDGINDIIYVNGFGIETMTWSIYNRWGKLLFTSTKFSNGWDGRYEGVLQPMDVYQYLLDVKFSDGTSFQKSGDITLLN